MNWNWQNYACTQVLDLITQYMYMFNQRYVKRSCSIIYLLHNDIKIIEIGIYTEDLWYCQNEEKIGKNWEIRIFGQGIARKSHRLLRKIEVCIFFGFTWIRPLCHMCHVKLCP